jgi:hypothetical protein
MQFNQARLEHANSEDRGEPFFGEEVEISDFPNLPHCKSSEHADMVSMRTLQRSCLCDALLTCGRTAGVR